MMAEVNLMCEAAEEINQDYANWLLFEAWKAYNLSCIYWDMNDHDAWREHENVAYHLYMAWSKYTNIEFENGFADLNGFTEDDFAKFGLVW